MKRPVYPIVDLMARQAGADTFVAAERHTALAEEAGVALGQRADEVVGEGGLRGGTAIRLACLSRRFSAA